MDRARSLPGVLVDTPHPAIVRVLLDRPERRNAIDEEVVDGLGDTVAAVAEDDEVRVLILGSRAPGMFCSGADLSVSDAARADISRGLYSLYEQLLILPAITIAAVDGPAVGGGAQLVLASDIRVLSPAGSIRFVGPGHGLAVGAWGLPSLVGRGAAMRLCLTGEAVPAERAQAIGLADDVRADPDAAALELADRFAGLDRDAVRRVKRLVVDGAGVLEALRAEAAGNASWTGTVPGR